MNYYELLGFKIEPFNLSADPYFFYPSIEHKDCLERLEVSIRMRQGLNVVFGDIGTGKTTIMETLKTRLLSDNRFVLRTIYDPSFNSEFQFLYKLISLFEIAPTMRSTIAYKDDIKDFLFKKTVEEKKTVVLIIDEGQKLTPTFLEILRLFLNYQTPDFFLINIVIFAQMEFLNRVKRKKSFMDRISVSYVINPLNREDTENMIKFRLKQAGLNSGRELFKKEVYDAIYKHSKGRPRKICKICKDCLMSIVLNRKESDLITNIQIEEWVKKEVALIGKS